MKKGLTLLLILSLVLVIISGCDKVTNECIKDLNVLEEKFGIEKGDVTIIESECEICTPWPVPQVHKFSAVVEDKEGTEYALFFSDNCPRHGKGVSDFCVMTKPSATHYSTIKNKICSHLDYPGEFEEYFQNCNEGTYETNSGSNIILSLSRHIAGTPMDDPPEDYDFSGVKPLPSQNCKDIK